MKSQNNKQWQKHKFQEVKWGRPQFPNCETSSAYNELLHIEKFQNVALLCICFVWVSSCAFSSFPGVPFVGCTEYHRRWLYVHLLSEVIQVLLPPSLIEHAEDAAGLPAVPQSPRTQGSEQWLQASRKKVNRGRNISALRHNKEITLIL